MNTLFKLNITRGMELKNFNVLKKEINIFSKSLDSFYLNEKVYRYNLLNYILSFEKIKKKGLSILDLCISLDCFIPHYCYHFNLSIAGNCRMCLVELNTSQKPVVSCAVKITRNTRIKTNTFLIKRSREGIMEFLLVNHPLDCPICDQGGECDLQDQSLTYGSVRGRFYHLDDFKRSVTDFMCHPMIKVILTRCIHCTRCVRFLNEIEGNYNLGMLGRGNNSEIGLYTDNLLVTELGSNITDICPVGALTIKPYALHYRAWDNIYLESIDLTDSFCSPIRAYSNLMKIKRILPDFNNELKVNWIHEKTRYFYDALILQKLEFPLIRKTNFDKSFKFLKTKLNNNKNLKYFFKKISWTNFTKNFLGFLKNFKSNFNFKIFIGDFLDIFSLFKLKSLSNFTNSKIYMFSEKVLDSKSKLINLDLESNYIFQITEFEGYDNIFLINLNLRFESPILNAKLRQYILWSKRISINYIGVRYNLTYKYTHLGTSTNVLLRLVEGKILNLSLNNKNNLLLYNNELLKCYNNTGYRSILTLFNTLNNKFKLMFLARSITTIGGSDLILEQKKNKKLNNNKNIVYYFIGSNQFLLNIKNLVKNLVHNLTIYQDSIGDKYYNFIDIFLPSNSFIEAEVEYYINCYGILKMSRQILFPINVWVKDNLDIIKIISKLSFNYKKNKTIQRTLVDFFKILPLHLYKKRRINLFKIMETKIYNTKIYYFLFTLKTRNFFKTNNLINNSQNLRLISEVYFLKKTNFTL